MANLTRGEVMAIIRRAPSGTTPEGIMAALEAKGHTLDMRDGWVVPPEGSQPGNPPPLLSEGYDAGGGDADLPLEDPGLMDPSNLLPLVRGGQAALAAGQAGIRGVGSMLSGLSGNPVLGRLARLVPGAGRAMDAVDLAQALRGAGQAAAPAAAEAGTVASRMAQIRAVPFPRPVPKGKVQVSGYVRSAPKAKPKPKPKPKPAPKAATGPKLVPKPTTAEKAPRRLARKASKEARASDEGRDRARREIAARRGEGTPQRGLEVPGQLQNDLQRSVLLDQELIRRGITDPHEKAAVLNMLRRQGLVP